MHPHRTTPRSLIIEPQFVYFIQASDRIKIGRTKDPLTRLLRLRQDTTGLVRFLGAITCSDSEEARKLEALLHHRFATLRVAGEWFKVGSELSEFISTQPLVHLDEIEAMTQWCKVWATTATFEK